MSNRRLLHEIAIFLILVSILFVIGCSKNSHEPIILTQQEDSPWDLLLLTPPGKLIIDNSGYIRFSIPHEHDKPVIIWPHGFTLKIDGSDVWVLNEKSEPQVRIGDTTPLGGGFIEESSVTKVIGYSLPADIPGPFFMAGHHIPGK